MSREFNEPGDRVTFSMIVTQLISQSLAARQMTQKDFLQQSGISQATWSRISRGQSSLSIEDLRAACRTLEVDAASLIRDAEEVEANLPAMDIEVVAPVGPAVAARYAGAFIAGAVLSFLISRVRK